jgi:NADPH:quinone reductase-like Zn-dependent oxidoreductase
MVIRAFGPASVMRLEELPDPVPGPEDVVIDVHAVSVNRTLDIVVRSGNYARPIQLPHVLGADPSGVIAAVGDAVRDRHVGQRVATFPHVRPPTAETPPQMLGVQVWGGYAEKVVVPARATHLIPDGLDFIQATVVARHAPVAFSLLREKANLQRGDRVLVMGAGGGLGSAGVQVSKYLGATVIAAAGSDERVAAAQSVGADFGVNYRTSGLTAEVMRLTQGKGVNVVFENVGDPDLFPKAFAALGRNGRLITAGAHGGGVVPLDVRKLYLNQITVIGSTGQNPADTDLSLKVAAAGALRFDISRVLPLERAAEAHELVESRAVSGKVVLTPAG